MHCGAVGQRLYGLYAMQEECGERFAGQLSDKVREKGFAIHSCRFDQHTAAKKRLKNSETIASE